MKPANALSSLFLSASPLRTLAACAVLAGHAVLAHAATPASFGGRLFSVSEWNRACAKFGAPENVALCKAKLHRAVASGRSLGPFELITPRDQSLLQSRSGVLFRPDLNSHVVRVQEDTGLKTTVRLPDDVRCQAYAAAPDVVGVPRQGHGYRSLIDAWLQTYTDAKSQIRSVSIQRQNGRHTLTFDAVTADNRAIRGSYAFDERANAAIFSTCDHPLASIGAQENAELFFDAIVGSARRFL